MKKTYNSNFSSHSHFKPLRVFGSHKGELQHNKTSSILSMRASCDGLQRPHGQYRNVYRGDINIETDKNNSELVITAKVGADTYKKNYVYLNEFTIYVVEDIDGTHTDPYHYKVFFDWKWIDFEVK